MSDLKAGLYIKSNADLNGSFFEHTTILIVEHDEARIDGLIAPLACDDRARMPAQTRLGLKQRDVVVIGQKMRCAHTRDPAPDHSNVSAGHRACFKGHGVSS